jgi:hypothetical protein
MVEGDTDVIVFDGWHDRGGEAQPLFGWREQECWEYGMWIECEGFGNLPGGFHETV